MPSKHLFKLSQVTPQEQNPAGMRIRAHKQNFPALEGMSLYKLIMHPNGIREPHWHANADELGYCIKGQVLVNVYNTGDVRSTFIVNPGEVFLVPSGALHHIENIGQDVAELIICFSNEETEDFNLSSSIAMFSNPVLGNTWDVDASVFQSYKRPAESIFMALRSGPAEIPDYARYSSPFHYDLEGALPLLQNEGGSARMARENVWPIAQRQALYSLHLTGQGMREPHWHPETAELGYVNKGRGRMSILSPSGSVDTYVMEEGDIYFIPKAYPHHIENLQNDSLHLLIFFDQSMPRDIGFTGSIRSYSDQVLSVTTGFNQEILSKLPKYYVDSFIVMKKNPVEN